MQLIRTEFFINFFLLSNLAAFGQSTGFAPLQYIVYQCHHPILIDGKADSLWDSAPWSTFFTDIEGKKTPKYKTGVKMLWDKEYLYFYAMLEEPHVWGNITQRDAVIFHNNDFEIFIDPVGTTHHYMEFEINALNTVWDLFLTKPYRNNGKVIDSWDITGLKTAVYVDGTLNDPSDEDNGWGVEVAMPWSSITEAANHHDPPANEYWRMNFSRVNWDFELNEDGAYERKKDHQGRYQPEYNWVWSPQGVINMHEPERWGYVYFSEESATSNQAFQLPGDEPLKWELYGIYRKIRDRAGNHPEAVVATVDVQGKKVPVHLEHHRTGWNLWVESPFSGQILMLKEDGELTIGHTDH